MGRPAAPVRRRPVLARLRALASAQQGAAAIEFAVVAPVFILMLVEILDLGHMAYARAILNGAVQDAARASALETADTSEADEFVTESIAGVIPNAVLASTRSSYFDFADIGRSERINDTNGNGDCDAGETYTDENNNGEWDEDVGVAGNGGAGDVVVYRVTVTYDPIFRIPFLPDAWTEREMTATAIKKNQPFADQDEYSSTARSC